MTNHARLFEPLDCPDTALVLVDHQVGLMTGVRDISTGRLKHNVVGLAKAAKLLNPPIVVTTTARDSMWGPTFPELVEALPGIDIIDRATVNAFDDARVSRDRGDRPETAIFAGVSLELCAAFPAMTAVGKGLDAYVAVDACGTFSQTKREVGLLRMLQAGVITTDYASLMVEILKDNSRPDAGAIYGAIDMPWAKLVGRDRPGGTASRDCSVLTLSGLPAIAEIIDVMPEARTIDGVKSVVSCTPDSSTDPTTGPDVHESGRRLVEPAKAASLFEAHCAKPWRTCQ